MIGNNGTSTQTMTRLWKSNPNQNPNSGTIARMGIVCSATAYG